MEIGHTQLTLSSCYKQNDVRRMYSPHLAVLSVARDSCRLLHHLLSQLSDLQ